ncbi:ABC transporter ATP-binding protein [Halorubrum sp. Eb13]|uniref:ABC transporter ATP-binding protein n=1 Tax=Halorubrum sp. Eb13 TaxID=1383843 RepID=UPI000B985951|nr:ABC transporter ATP-binding protein [Halorubrum sp. Eb13]OYR41432.1 multidrug ABC transporter permease [Halorubrum sp. Eb13]
MPEIENEPVPRREKLDSLLSAARYDPKFTILLIGLGIVVAVLEGVGLTFIVPVVELLQSNDPVSEADGLMALFVSAYQILGIPFTIGFVVVGVSAVMTFRYTGSFLYSYLRRLLRFNYQRHLQKRAFDSALEARMAYFDKEGSDEILNTIITESATAAGVINKIVKLINAVLLTSVYLLIALWVSPLLTLVAVGILGTITFVLRYVIDPGYKVGDKVADANERRHQSAQAGMIGIRDIRIFNLTDEIYESFVDAVDMYTYNIVKLKRNQSAIRNFYNLAVSVFVFMLIYLALRLANLSFGELGLFLFTMFQLAPRASELNELAYTIENELPHLVRTQRFVNELEQLREPAGDARTVPETVNSVEFDNVKFSYNDDETVLSGVDFTVEKGEFVAFVGQSGAGKSTIVSLLARYYEPDSGRIHANGEPIDEMDPREWRDRIAVVRQSPYIFNESLRYNLTVGNRDATRHDLKRACEISRVDEFFDDLPNGYDSQLGDEGVRLSGGQKQRLALARALLKDADLLILDEATSDLDTNLEQEVQRAIEKMDRDYGIITIAHRLSTVENADRIYTMENGRISERGAHNELVENGGKYAELYAVQLG